MLPSSPSSWRGPLCSALLVSLLLLGLCWLAAPASATSAPGQRQASDTATPELDPTETQTATRTPSTDAEPTPTKTLTPTAALLPTATTASTATSEPTATSTATSTVAPATPTAPADEPPAPALAPQQALRLEISKTLLGSDVVQVGQYLTFTIQVTNTGSMTVTTLPLVDEYETTILQPALDRITPAPTSSAAGVLRWTDLTDVFGDLGPGQRVSVTAVFRAIRIDDEVINRARVEAASGIGGGGGGSFEDRADGRVEGGRVIVEKRLVESFIRLDTPVISFTLSLRNDGFADVVRLPFDDTYRADLLRFARSDIPPDIHNPATGQLRWNDLLASTGRTRLRPQEVITFTTVFTVTGPIEDAVVNSANALDVADEFGNQVQSPRRAEVRIRVRGTTVETATPTPAPTLTATPATPATETAAPRRERTPTPAAPTATTSPVPVQTPPNQTTTPETTPIGPTTPTPTDVSATSPTPTPATPVGLPRTGSEPGMLWLLLLASLALLAGVGLHMVRQGGK